MFRPGHRAGVSIWENFHPGNRDLGNQASPASHMNTSIFLQRKEKRGEISETEPARLTGLIRRGPYISNLLFSSFLQFKGHFRQGQTISKYSWFATIKLQQWYTSNGSLPTYPLVIVSDFCIHANSHDERGIFFTVFKQSQVTIHSCQISWRPHKEHFTSTWCQTLFLTLL